MNYRLYLDQMTKLHQELLYFIDSDDDETENFKNLCQSIDDQNIKNNLYDLKLFLYLIARISSDHHRNSTFFNKIEQVINFLKTEITNSFKNTDIFNIFKDNQRILLFLIEEKILSMDQSIADNIVKLRYDQYFFPEIEPFHKYHYYRQKFDKLPENFDENRKIGENDSQICKLIRNDSIEDFIIYVNQYNIDLSSNIKESIYETNSFLVKFQANLIEYSAFFGAIKIFKYLMDNKVNLSPSIWYFAIHNRNAEIILILEENNVTPNQKHYLWGSGYGYGYLANGYFEWFVESIKCHHNEIANYIKDNYLTDQNLNSKNINSKYVQFYNFEFFQDDVIQSTFCDLYICEYHNLVYLLKKDIIIDVNQFHTVFIFLLRKFYIYLF